MNSVRYGIPKKSLCNKMYKKNAVPPIKVKIHNRYSCSSIKKKRKAKKKKLNMWLNVTNLRENIEK